MSTIEEYPLQKSGFTSVTFLRLSIALFLFSLLLPVTAEAIHDDSDPAEEELAAWELFLQEVDTAGAAAPAQEATIPPPALLRDESIRIFLFGGHTNNSLLSARKVPAAFLGVGAEAFVWQTDGFHFFTVWALAERRRFSSAEEDLEDEWTAALHLRYEHGLPLGAWTLEGGITATRQVYDAADTALPGEAAVDFLGVILPRASFSWKRLFGFGQELEWGFTSEHVLYQDIDYNNSLHGLRLQLRTPLAHGTSATVGGAVRDVHFEDEPPRSATGLPLSAERLRFVRYDADILLQHERTWGPEHFWQLRFFGSWIPSNSSPWHGFDRRGWEFRGRSVLSPWRLHYRWSRAAVSYRARQGAPGVTAPLKQRRHTGVVGLEYNPGSWQLRGELEYNRFFSNDPKSSYRARQVTATLAKDF
ncbi:MAG: hypothetical protein JJT96_18270 [Opitutales bacterium]|nr:hypothetical protein [Opitutales bacterium]